MILSAAVWLAAACVSKPVSDYPVADVPLTAVKRAGGFWGARQATDIAVTISHQIKENESTGRITNFELAGAALRGKTGGKFASHYAFDDSDVYKTIEAAAYVLMLKPDPGLDKKLDEWIAKIAAAQEPDGYLYTARTIDPKKPHSMSGPERWVNLKDSHELYCLGHLYEAAVAHSQATGKRTLLDVALKSADFIVKTFGPGEKQVHRVPGHEEIELGLVKLYRATGKAKYLDLARYFIDQRGNAAGHELYGEYAQDHKPVREQTEAVGHAVRAAYLYSGMADVSALTGDASLMTALDAIWEDVVGKKLYLTGGIGAAVGWEGFGPAFDLPNPSGYAETCATIAYALWNYRMFRAKADGKYMDLFERAAMNAFLSGSGMSGDLYFYPNPLASFGQHERTPWFGCACCPPNVARFIAEMGGFVYGLAGDKVYVNLYAAGTAKVGAPGGPLTIGQTTDYPWSGRVVLKIEPSRPEKLTILLRIPGWAQGRPMPSDLYRYADATAEPVILKVNGEAVPITIEKGYAAVSREWKSGDTVELSLPMPVRRVLANEAVKSDIGRVAVERGPLVFCAEGVDNGGRVAGLVLDDAASLTAVPKPDLLNGLTIVTGPAAAMEIKKNKLTGHPQPLTLIPYYAWAHRGRGEMEVWIAREAGKARPAMEPGLAAQAKVAASEGAQRLKGINDQYDPERSDDSVGYMHWWPKKGTAEWVEYDFDKPVRLSETSVYWFDDTGGGECRVPAEWRAFYKAGTTWVSVRTKDPFGTAKDAYNTVRFAPVATSGLRLEIRFPKEFSGGIQEWKVK
ncbi:MAG: glycoside hydrolase family 127 protein [Acidobacteriota bacterium]|nr:glycoside hydrolase family 127 protein [Acidobacteriota bacterium]